MTSNFQPIEEAKNLFDDSGYKKPTPKTVSRKRRKMRADIEEAMGEKWEEIERAVCRKVKEAMAKRHFLIRNSPQFIAVIEMILAGEKAMNIRSFLRKKDPGRFSGELISDNALLQQIIRFQEEVTANLKENDQEFVTVMDMYARFSGRHFDPLAMMKKLILVQETRLSAALDKELEVLGAIQRLPREKQAKKLPKIFRMASKEIDRLQKYTAAYLLYEVMNKPCTYDQKEFIHCVLRAYRNYLPRFSRKGIENR